MEACNATWARAFYGQDTLPPLAMQQHRFSMGVSGAGVLGWTVTLMFIVLGPYRRRENWAWTCVAVSVAVWAVCDLVLSLVHGVAGEVVFAACAGFGILLPVLLARREFSIPEPAREFMYDTMLSVARHA